MSYFFQAPLKNVRLLREARTWGKSEPPDKNISPPKMLRFAL